MEISYLGDFFFMTIITEEGKFMENLYLIDTKQFKMPKITTSFCYWDGNTCLLMDVGTSIDVRSTLRFLRKNDIPFSKVVGIVPSHYHFDHFGGATKIWSKMVEKNPDFKIYTPQDTHDFIQDAKEHLVGAKSTFGFVGTMNPAPEKAFEIVKKDVNLPIDLGEGYTIRLISTPGHTPDYNSPTIFLNGKTRFCFSGEAAGNLYHRSKIISTVSSMPSNFNFEIYIESLQKIKDMEPESLGMSHFGVLVGQKECLIYLEDQKNLIIDFRNTIIKYYNEDPSVRSILAKMGTQFWEDRLDPSISNNELSRKIFSNIKLALTYGMMIDLGYRKSKYEPRYYQNNKK